jgi:hypothetical protein
MRMIERKGSASAFFLTRTHATWLHYASNIMDDWTINLENKHSNIRNTESFNQIDPEYCTIALSEQEGSND